MYEKCNTSSVSDAQKTFPPSIKVMISYVTFLLWSRLNKWGGYLYPPYPKDRGMLWFYVEAVRRPPPAARNGVNAITQKPRDVRPSVHPFVRQ